MAVEAIDSAGTRTCFHRPAACRLLHHGEGSHFWVRDGDDCGGRPTATIELQDQSGAAHPGWGDHWCIVLGAVKGNFQLGKNNKRYRWHPKAEGLSWI